MADCNRNTALYPLGQNHTDTTTTTTSSTTVKTTSTHDDVVAFARRESEQDSKTTLLIRGQWTTAGRNSFFKQNNNIPQYVFYLQSYLFTQMRRPRYTVRWTGPRAAPDCSGSVGHWWLTLQRRWIAGSPQTTRALSLRSILWRWKKEKYYIKVCRALYVKTKCTHPGPA